MKYLFFDIECANCFNGKGKMIEFGYCITNEKFEMISKDTLVMSPGKEKFDKGIYKRDPSFQFAYEYDYYYGQPEFPTFYEKIKNLLEDNDTLIFGYAVSNDIRYLSYTCERYRLKPFDFIAYDGQSMISYYSTKHTRLSGLENAAKILCDHNELVKLQPHLSRDDAIMSMMIIKQMCINLEISVIELIRLCSNCKFDTNKYIKLLKDKRLHPEKYMTTKRFKTNEEACKLYENLVNDNKELLNDTKYNGKVITISALLKIDINQTIKIIDNIKSKGFIATDKIGESNFILVLNEDDANRLKRKFKKPYFGKYITLEEFYSL